MYRRLVFPILMALLCASVVSAQSPYDRAAYWDGNYGTAWAGDGIAVRDALEQAGYTVLNADGLKTWMDGHIADGALSVVVFCRDAVPDTVAETQDENCTMRRYLEAGGKIVWYSDIPCYYRTTSGGANTTWGDNGSLNVLGWAGSSATRDSGNTVTITEAGAEWGLTTTWSSTRPTLPTAWPNMTILAVDNAGNASGWVAHYLEGDTFRGFVRIEDHTGAPASINNLIAVAEYAEFLTGAASPIPQDGATDVRRDINLSWVPGAYAVTHDVYFGTNFDDVNDASRTDQRGVLVSRGQTATTYDLPGLLDLDATYYWRVDEVNGAPDFTVFKGDVWSFTAEPFAYAIEGIVATSNAVPVAGKGPENTVNGSGLNQNDQHSVSTIYMWEGKPNPDEPTYIQFDFDSIYKLHEMLVWNYNMEFEMFLGVGLKNVTVEYSDGTEWMTLGDYQFAQGTGRNTYTYNTVVDFGGIGVKAVRLVINSGFGTTASLYGLSEVRFLYIPAFAREPQPADGATGVDPTAILGWRGGRDAVTHEVYFGTDEEAVANGTALVGTPAEPSYNPDGLDYGNLFYWKVIEVADDASWEGNIWSFSTKEFQTLEDFESYTDDTEAGEAIWQTWIDGIDDPGTNGGGVVGYDQSPFAEKTIVHGGGQAMPLFYDNTESPYYSQTYRAWATGQNWTANGANSLRLHVRGNPLGFEQRADGTVVMGGTGNDIWGTADEFRMTYKRLNGDGFIIARVDSLVHAAGWSKAGVMIRETLNANSKHAMVVLTPANGVAMQYRTSAGADSTNFNLTGFTAPYWVKLTRSGNTFTGQRSADGVNWVSITNNPAESTVTISMVANVYVGLAIAANSGGINPLVAEFSNISGSTNITGQWTMVDIGGDQPSNDLAPLYVTVEDGNGRSKRVVNSDPEAIWALTWKPWVIPLSEFSNAGVNMTNVRKMYIGLGDRNNPSSGGTGLIYVDDIGFGAPLASNVTSDITSPGDEVVGVPNDGDWPAAETPDLAIDNNTSTKFLHFKGFEVPTGFQTTPSIGATVVTGLTLTTANDHADRDPITYEVYGSNEGIDGPYTLIASGDVVDFAQETEWPRFTKTETPIMFDNDVAYTHYQILFTAVRDPSVANSMQIAEVELLGKIAQ